MDEDYHRSEILLVQSFLNELVDKYKLTPLTIAIEIGCAEESVRSWGRGRRLPQPQWREKILLLLQHIQETGIVPKQRGTGRRCYKKRRPI
jgi:hypothetical protein